MRRVRAGGSKELSVNWYLPRIELCRREVLEWEETGGGDDDCKVQEGREEREADGIFVQYVRAFPIEYAYVERAREGRLSTDS